MPSAQTRDKSAVTPEQMKKLTDTLKDEFDFILLDCPAGIEQGFRNAIAGADRAVVVTTPEVSAIRDADRVIGLLDGAGITRKELLVNRIRPELVRRGDMMTLEDIHEILAIPMVGAITDTEEIVIAGNSGEPVAGQDCPTGQAFMDVCRRLMGETIPIGMPETKKGMWKRFRSMFDRK